jgi:hypothetical protein
MQQRMAQVLFNHIAGNAEAPADVVLIQVLELAQDEHLPAARRQFVDGHQERLQSLAVMELRFG